MGLMRVEDDMRLWVRSKLAERGRGARKELAAFLGLTADQITRMLNMEEGKETRAIKADEWLKIKNFFALEDGQKTIERLASVGAVRLVQVYDSAPSDSQKILLEFAEFIAYRSKKRRRAASRRDPAKALK